MNLAEVIYKKSLDLPLEKAREVIDFIEFLRTRPASLVDDRSSDSDLEIRRQKAREQLEKVRIDFGGKPMTDREEANARR